MSIRDQIHADAVAALRSLRADGVEGRELHGAIQAVGVAYRGLSLPEPEPEPEPQEPEWCVGSLLAGRVADVEKTVLDIDDEDLLEAALIVATRKGARSAIGERLEVLRA